MYLLIRNEKTVYNKGVRKNEILIYSMLSAIFIPFKTIKMATIFLRMILRKLALLLFGRHEQSSLLGLDWVNKLQVNLQNVLF